MTGARHVRYVASRGERRAEVVVEEVDPGAGLYRVTIDGRTRLVEWAPAASRHEGSLRIDDRFQHEFALIHEGPERRHVEALPRPDQRRMRRGPRGRGAGIVARGRRFPRRGASWPRSRGGS